MKEHTLEKISYNPIKASTPREGKSHVYHSVLGGFSGMLMETILHPMDTIRTRMKSNRSEFLSFNQTIKRMYVKEGPRVFFRGFSCTLSGSFMANATYFYCYETLKHQFKLKKLMSDDFVPFVSAFLAGFCQDLVYIPCDIVRTRMQLDNQYDYKNVADGLYKIVTREGPGKLYLGGPTFFALDLLHTSLTFGFYELFQKKLRTYFKSPSDGEFDLRLSVISSMTAASLSAVVTNPLDVLVTRFQMVNTLTEKPLPFLQCVSSIHANEGLKGFMKGYTGRVLYYSCAALILFPTYECLKKVCGVDLTDLEQDQF